MKRLFLYYLKPFLFFLACHALTLLIGLDFFDASFVGLDPSDGLLAYFLLMSHTIMTVSIAYQHLKQQAPALFG